MLDIPRHYMTRATIAQTNAIGFARIKALRDARSARAFARVELERIFAMRIK